VKGKKKFAETLAEHVLSIARPTRVPPHPPSTETSGTTETTETSECILHAGAAIGEAIYRARIKFQPAARKFPKKICIQFFVSYFFDAGVIFGSPGNFATIGKTVMAIPSCPTTYWHDLRNAKAYAARNEFDCAIIAFTQIIDDVDPPVHCPKTGTEPPYKAYCEAHYERGVAYAQKAKHEDAIRDFGAVIAEAKNPAVARLIKKFLIDAYLQRGILFASQGDARQAIDDFTEVIRLKQHYSEAYYRRAIAYLEGREPQLAAVDFDRARTLDPFGFPELRAAFLSIAPSKAWPTFPDARFGNTLSDRDDCNAQTETLPEIQN
jgi:tetratricopeptide (TPR) repeat protein